MNLRWKILYYDSLILKCLILSPKQPVTKVEAIDLMFKGSN